MALINCPECSQEVSDQADTCPNCGILIKKSAHKDSKRKYIIIGLPVLGALVAIIVIFIITFMDKPITDFKNALNDENWEAVISIYNENKTEEDFLIESTEVLESFIDATVNDFIKDILSFDDVMERLDSINSLISIQEATAFLERIKKSKTAFEIAENAKQNEDYYIAIVNYESVIAEDTLNYDVAQEARANSISLLIQSVIDEADALASNGDLIGAYQTLIKLPNEYRDNSYEEIIEKAKNSVVDDAVVSGNSLISSSDYVGAHKFLSSLPNDFKTNDINALINKASESYRTEILSQAEFQVSQGNYDAAISILEDANKQIRISVFSSTITTYKKEKDVSYLLNVKNQVNIRYDEIEQRHHIEPNINSYNISGDLNVVAAFQAVNNNTVFGLMFGFTQSDWLFMEKIIIASGDKRVEINVPFSNRITRVGYGNITEAFSVEHRHSKFNEALELLINSDTTTIRFVGSRGRGNRDHTVTAREKDSIRVLWGVYSVLKNDFSLIEYLK
jgi:tetratricopeptide (TPR) repeat protein